MRRTLLVLALLTAPALQAGTVLRGGSFATVERPASLPADAEEWEAFLSLDGGRYYAFRITPHLDIAQRTFTWVVPNVDAPRARILIRAGDERRETLYESPSTFAIARDARAEMPHRAIVPSARGEAARAGDPGVVAWTDGDRSGGALVERWAGSRGVALAGVRNDRGESQPFVAPGTSLVLSSWFFVLRTADDKPKNQELRTKNLLPQDVLLLTTRLNV